MQPCELLGHLLWLGSVGVLVAFVLLHWRDVVGKGGS